MTAFLLTALMFALALLDTFAPAVVAMLIAWRLFGRSLGRNLLAALAGVLGGLAAYAVLGLLPFFVLPRPPFDPVSLLVAAGYAVAGALGGLGIARRLDFAPRSRGFG